MTDDIKAEDLEGETVKVKEIPQNEHGSGCVVLEHEGREIAILPITQKRLENGSRLLGVNVTYNRV